MEKSVAKCESDFSISWKNILVCGNLKKVKPLKKVSVCLVLWAKVDKIFKILYFMTLELDAMHIHFLLRPLWVHRATYIKLSWVSPLEHAVESVSIGVRFPAVFTWDWFSGASDFAEKILISYTKWMTWEMTSRINTNIILIAQKFESNAWVYCPKQDT